MDVIEGLQEILDGIVAIIDLENLLVENLILEEFLENDFDPGNLPEDLVQGYHDLYEVLNAIIGNIEQLQEVEDNVLEDLLEENNADERLARGEFFQLNVERFRNLEDPEFHRPFRMNKETFEVLVLEFGNHLVATGRLIRLRTGLDMCLLMALWILGNLSTFRGTGVTFGVSQSVVHYHYVIVIEALCELCPKFIKWPTEAEKARTKAACQRRTGFPGIVGMMDGSLVKITAPLVQRERYFDRHHNYSMNVHVVCDHNLLLRHIYVGEAGGVHDARVFERSRLFDDLLEGDELVANDEHILADSAYTMTNKVITPYRDNGNLSPRQRRFNFIQSSNRMCVERSNGHWKEKWRRLYGLQVRNFDYGIDHIMSTLMLHNFVKLDGREINGIQLPPRPPVEQDRDALNDHREHPMLRAARAGGVLKRDAIALVLTPN